MKDTIHPMNKFVRW